MNIHALITALVDYAIRVELAPQEERAYMTNMLLTTLGLSEYEQPVEPVPELPLEEILGQMCDYAFEQGLIDSNTVVYRDLYDTALMNAVTPRPGEVIRTFRDLYKQNPEAYKGSVADVSMFLRVAVTGRTNSPDLYTVMQILGKERSLDRIQKVIADLR